MLRLGHRIEVIKEDSIVVIHHIQISHIVLVAVACWLLLLPWLVCGRTLLSFRSKVLLILRLKVELFIIVSFKEVILPLVLHFVPTDGLL